MKAERALLSVRLAGQPRHQLLQIGKDGLKRGQARRGWIADIRLASNAIFGLCPGNRTDFCPVPF